MGHLMPRNYRIWTPEEDHRLREILFCEAGTYEDAAYELGRSIHSISRRVARLRLIRTPSGPVDHYKRAMVMNMLSRIPDCTASHIARTMGVSYQSTLSMIWKLVKQGLVKRTGGCTQKCRYVVTRKWIADQPHIEIGGKDHEPGESGSVTGGDGTGCHLGIVPSSRDYPPPGRGCGAAEQ